VLVVAAAAAIPTGVWLTGNPFVFGVVQGRILVFSFLAGVALFNLSDRVPFSAGLAFMAAGLVIIGFLHPQWSYFAVLPVAYLTVWIGLQRLPVVLGTDYSYGLYLFAFPLQQAIWLLLPFARSWWMNLLLALPLGLVYAAFSWHWVERPVLRRKRDIIAMLSRPQAVWRAVRG
jgi:peptidoglycan/LPS O-acetylase OafA/YrhL